MKELIFGCVFTLSLNLSAQNVEVVKFSELQDKMLSTETELTVFNFWATWCAPCIKEIPYFEEIGNRKEIKVYLVSLDFPNQLDKVKKFVANKELKSEVLFLDEKDPDTYMPKVSQTWTGAIPATLFVNDLGKTFFHEKAFTKEELEKTINNYLN